MRTIKLLVSAILLVCAYQAQPATSQDSTDLANSPNPADSRAATSGSHSRPTTSKETALAQAEAASLTDRAAELYSKNKTEACLVAATKGQTLDPSNSQAAMYRGLCLARMERTHAAMAQLLLYFKLNKLPVESSPCEALASCYCSLGQYKEALPYYTKWTQVQPTLGTPYYQRAQAYCQLKLFDKAIADAKKAVELDANAGNYALAAKIYIQAGKQQEALAAYDKAVQKAPDSPISYSQRARLLEKMGKADLAAKDRKKADALVRENLSP